MSNFAVAQSKGVSENALQGRDFFPLQRAVVVVTMGCRTNQGETQSLCAALASCGFRIVDRLADADIVVFNTCTVTAAAESQAMRMLRSLRRAAPQVEILVTGCLAQQKPHELAKMDGVRWVVGNTLKENIPKILEGEGGTFVSSIIDETLQMAELILPPHKSLRTRYTLKIQEGCDYRCAYCIVPLLRGKSRSAPLLDVVEAARRAIDVGYRELVLTGTHIGQYQSNGAYLADLLERLVLLPGDFRLRLSSLDPRDLTPRLLDVWKSEERICDHLHLSVQSLSDHVLRAMQRDQIGVDEIASCVASLKAGRPRCAVGGDFIVGFPVETEAMFTETLERVSEIGFTYGHVFRFSPRPGTPAAAMHSRISAQEMAERSDVLRSLLIKRRMAFAHLMRDSCVRVLVEQEHPAMGLASNYLRVAIPGCHERKNAWVWARIFAYDDAANLCLGELYDE